MEKISFDLLLKSALDLFYGAIDALETEEYENALINELCILVWDFKHRKIKGKKVFSKLDTIAENYKGKLQHIDTNIRLIFTTISNLYSMLEREIIDQIISAWQCYVEEDDSKLVPKAQELKYRYKEIFKKLEVSKK